MLEAGLWALLYAAAVLVLGVEALGITLLVRAWRLMNQVSVTIEASEGE